MADFTFNCAKGRVVELYKRVDTADPANCAIILVPLSQSGTEAQGQDLDSLQAIESDANFAEQSTSWSRKPLTDAQLVEDPGPNDTDNRYDVAVPSVTWTGPTAGNNTTGLLVCYDPDTTSGTDANIIPLTHHTFTVTADGNDVVLNAGNFYQAA